MEYYTKIAIGKEINNLVNKIEPILLTNAEKKRVNTTIMMITNQKYAHIENEKIKHKEFRYLDNYDYAEKIPDKNLVI